MKKLLLLMIPLVLILAGCSPGPENLIGPDASGIWDLIVKFFSYGLIYTGKLFGNNIIWGLVGMTILFRVVMLPLYRAQIKSSANIAKMQPEINKINKKFEGKKDQESMQKKQVEMSALYKRHNINPIAGCLPMLIQMPLLFAFYGSINNLMVYTQNGKTGLDLYNVTGMTNNFLFWDNLGEPVIIFGALAALATYISTALSMYGSEAPPNQMMNTMKYVMPVMILIMGIQLPGALSLYWLIGNIFQIGQTLIIRRSDIKAGMDRKKLLKNK